MRSVISCGRLYSNIFIDHSATLIRCLKMKLSALQRRYVCSPISLLKFVRRRLKKLENFRTGPGAGAGAGAGAGDSHSNVMHVLTHSLP